MKAILVRVGADQGKGGGWWNGPVDSQSREFAYVAIPEYSPLHAGSEKPYKMLGPVLARFGAQLPAPLFEARMHLDPDFEYLTYGDLGQRARQLKSLDTGDLVVFYAGLQDTHPPGKLVYAIIGLFEVAKLVRAIEVPTAERDTNAHTRRVLEANAEDLIVCGRPGSSGRLERCIPIGEYRDRAYRVRPELIDEWGGLSIGGGYLQRSVQLPRLLDPERFVKWFDRQNPKLVQVNN